MYTCRYLLHKDIYFMHLKMQSQCAHLFKENATIILTTPRIALFSTHVLGVGIIFICYVSTVGGNGQYFKLSNVEHLK